jgi:heme-degrading monooxygenase HmoA
LIVRLWRGIVRSELLAEYAEIVERTGIAESRETPGNRGAQLLTRDLGEGRSELVTLSWWDSFEDIRAFAGEDISVARYYPEDEPYLLERDETVAHFKVAPDR